MIKFRCPNCSQKLGVPEKYAGRRVKCSKCEQPGKVPQLEQVRTVAPTPKAVPAQKDAPSRKDIAAPKDPTSAGTAKQQPAPPRQVEKPDIFSEFEHTEADEIDPRLEEALQAARQQRAASRAKANGPAKKSRSSNRDSKSGGIEVRKSTRSQRTTIPELVPDILRLPVSLILSMLAAGVTIGIWVASAKAADSPLCFFALFVPIAAGLGFRFVLADRNFLHGILCIIIGLVSILAGKALLAKQVVIPHYRQLSNEEFLKDIPKALSDEKYRFDNTASAKHYAEELGFLQCAALISMVEDGTADPVKVRSLALGIIERSNTSTSIFNQLLDGPPGQTRNDFPDLDEESQEIMSEAGNRAAGWVFNKEHLAPAKKYYPAIARIKYQVQTLASISDPDKAFKFGMVGTLGIFDALWVLLGMGMGYLALMYD